MSDFNYEEALEPDVNIKVIGVGGGGGNAVELLIGRYPLFLLLLFLLLLFSVFCAVHGDPTVRFPHIR